MKIIMNITSLILILSSTLAFAKGGQIPIDPHSAGCTIFYKGGGVDYGNGKNDLCILEKANPRVKKIIHNIDRPINSPESNIDNTSEVSQAQTIHYICSTLDDSVIHIKKEPNYIEVKAFGDIFSTSGEHFEENYGFNFSAKAHIYKAEYTRGGEILFDVDRTLSGWVYIYPLYPGADHYDTFQITCEKIN